MDFLKSLQSEIEAQERILEAHPAYIKLKALCATRDAYRGAVVDVAKASGQPQKSFLSGGMLRSRSAPISGKSLDAVNTVIDYLRLMGAPARTAELMGVLQKAGIHFSGNAPQNILSSLLSRSPDVVSKGGHVGWALKEWESVKDETLDGKPSSTDHQPDAQGREAGPGVAHE